MFGTVYKPAPGEYPRTGVKGVEVKSIAAAYLLPFRGWLAMLKLRKSLAPLALINPFRQF